MGCHISIGLLYSEKIQFGRDMATKKRKELDIEDNSQENRNPSFPHEVLERVLNLVKSHKDRSAFSLVCRDWYDAERWSRTHVFIENCYSVSPEMVARRFPNIRSVTLTGKPRFYHFNLVPPNWGNDIHSWLVIFASAYPFLEELRLKRMTVTDEGLDFLARSFPGFKDLSLVSCDGFSTDGLASIASYCRYDIIFNHLNFGLIFLKNFCHERSQIGEELLYFTLDRIFSWDGLLRLSFSLFVEDMGCCLIFTAGMFWVNVFRETDC